MNIVETIESLIVDDRGFDYQGIREDLHVTIRIARDFYNFLMKFGDSPEPDRIDYMMGTIQSGMDGFFSLMYACGRGIGKETWTETFKPHRSWNFAELRTEFISRFESLSTAELSLGQRLASLFQLTHLELVFLAQNFPSAQMAEITEPPQSIEETKRDIFEAIADSRYLRAGRITVEESEARMEARRMRRKH